MAVMLLLFFVMSRIRLGLTTVIISHIAFNISFVTIVVRARLAGMDQRLEEAAQDLGPTNSRRFATSPSHS